VIEALVAKLAQVRRHVVLQVAALDRDIRRLVRSDETLRRFMTVPGVGPITAVAFLSTIDDPGRFRHARDVGPYLGLTPTRYQSGEVDRQGRISKCGDAFTRSCLYEAANVLLTKVQRFSPLKAWATRLAKRIGGKKARVAVARKIAVILQCIWTDGTEFWWTRTEDGLRHSPPHQLRSGGEGVSAGTAGDGDREESVGRSEVYLGPDRLRHSGATPLTPIVGRATRPRREP